MAKMKWPIRVWCVDMWIPIRYIQDKDFVRRMPGKGKKTIKQTCIGFVSTSGDKPYIEIAAKRHAQDVLQTLLHEIGHAVCLTLGLDYADTENHWNLFCQFYAGSLQSAGLLITPEGQEWPK